MAPQSTTCFSIEPDENGHAPDGACGNIWPYHPVFEANVAIAAIFAALTIAHLIQAIVFRKKYCWVIIMAGIWETIAFTLRTLGARYGRVIPFYVVSTILFILAPLWINAFVFMLASRLVGCGLTEPKIWRIHARSLTKLFVGIDIICFLVQAGGSSLMSSTANSEDTANKRKLGQTVYLVGCSIQLVFIFFFCVLMGRFHLMIRQGINDKSDTRRIKLLLYPMFVVLMLIVIRLIFRLAEFGPGMTHDNPLVSNEIWALALDAAPMIVAVAIMNIFHPGYLLHEDYDKTPAYLFRSVASH